MKTFDATAPLASDDQAEFWIGTWAAIALIGAATARAGRVSLDDLISLFADAETAGRAIDRRYVPLGAVRKFLERLVPSDDDPGDLEADAGERSERSLETLLAALHRATPPLILRAGPE